MSISDEVKIFVDNLVSQVDIESTAIIEKTSLALKKAELLNSKISEELIHHENANFKSEDEKFISLLETQVAVIEAEIELKDILLEIKDFQINQYKRIIDIEEVGGQINKVATELQGKMIAYKEKRLESYKKGLSSRKDGIDKKWMLANEYFPEEIIKHETLKAARLSASRKAGIVVEERQLIKMMPDPRKKA